MPRTYCKPTAYDLSAITELVVSTFDHAVAADWSSEASNSFRDEVSVQNLGNAIDSAFFCEVCIVDGNLAGVVLLPNPRIIALTFVSAKYRRLGIATALIEHGIREVTAHCPDVAVVCLNATRFAFPFYRAQGFFPISPEYEHRGAVVTRMALWSRYYNFLRGPGASANLSVNADPPARAFFFANADGGGPVT